MDSQRTDFPFTVDGSPDYAMVNVTIPRGRTLKAEASAMVYMDPSITMDSRAGGGFKRMLSGEGIFVNEFTARDQEARMGIAPGCPGDVAHIYLENETVYLQSSAFLASSPDVEFDIQYQGFKGFFSGERLFMARCSGTGDLWFNTFGGLLTIDVERDYVVDTGYLVGFTDSLEYTVRSIGGLRSLFFSGEGLVCEFTGRGTVWIQTRLIPAFVRWADTFRRVEKKSND